MKSQITKQSLAFCFKKQ